MYFLGPACCCGAGAGAGGRAQECVLVWAELEAWPLAAARCDVTVTGAAAICDLHICGHEGNSWRMASGCLAGWLA
jgi:hypothetical protein